MRNEQDNNEPVKGRIHSFPVKQDILFKKAIALVEEGDSEAAIPIAVGLVDAGFDHANTLLGHIYENGGPSVAQDFEKAFFYYQRAVDTVGAKHGWLGLARLYTDGSGVKQNFREALECYKVLAEDANDPIAWINLGRMHNTGTGVPKDVGVAKAYFERAARAGYVVADVELADLLRESGSLFKPFLLRAKAGIRAAILAYRNKNDVRLMSR